MNRHANRPLPVLTEAEKLRFYARVDKRGPNECWLFKSKSSPNKHRPFRVNDKQYLAHRIAYYLEHGEDPGEFDVCHTCDTPPCVNPHHLFKDTQAGNMQDKVQKGRQSRGELVASAKLTEREVVQIRHRYAVEMISVEQLGKEYGVGHRTIGAVVSGKTWAHLPVLATDRPRSLLQRGERNGFAKLTNDEVREIRKRRNGGDSLRSLATIYHVSKSTIHSIVSGAGWRSV